MIPVLKVASGLALSCVAFVLAWTVVLLIGMFVGVLKP